MQLHIGRFEITPDHVRLVSATVLVNLKFTSKVCLYLEIFPPKFSDSVSMINRFGTK